MALNTQWKWRDGLRTFYYDNYLVILGGWNDAGAFTPGDSTSQILVSDDEGATWTLLGDAPWSRRHFFGMQIIGTTLYVFGGDPFVPAKDIWTYDLTQGILVLATGGNWTEQTTDWGTTGGDRELFASWVYNGKIRMCGGQTELVAPTMFTDVVELNTSTWTWSNVGTLPISYFSTGIVVNDGTYIWLYCGGRYLDAGHDNFNTNVYRSSDGGATWSLYSALPSEITGYMYANGAYFNGSLWLKNGYGLTPTVGNQVGMWYYEYPNWIRTNTSPGATHASSLTTNGTNKMWLMGGNYTNYVIEISKD